MIDLLFIGLVNAHGQRVGDPVLLQVDHGCALILFFLHLRADLHGLPLADPLHLGQPFRFLLYDAEGILPEFPHDPGRQRGAHAPDGAGAQIPFHALLILRQDLLIAFHLKLAAVHGMLHIAAGKLQPLSLVDGLKASDAGDLLPVRDQLKNGISILRIPVYDMLHISGYLLHLHPRRPDTGCSLAIRPDTGRGCSHGAAPNHSVLPRLSQRRSLHFFRSRPYIRPEIPHIFRCRWQRPSSDPPRSWY